MTRKDFQLIADTVARLYKDFDCSPSEDTVSLSLVAEELADALATTNDRFNRETFLTACGVKG
jgi:hypothetical protein